MQNDDRGDSILNEEFEKALRGLKENKRPGVDLIAAELVQNLGHAENIILSKLVCDMYETGDIPSDYMVNKTVTMPKKVWTEKFENYRTISLIKHESKISITIIYRRLEQTIESSLDEDQFGFRKERGTRESLISLRLIQSGRLRVEKPTFIASVDLEEAFDNVS